jgi:hypothetical protein
VGPGAVRRVGTATILPTVTAGQASDKEPYRMETIGNRVNLVASLEAHQIDELRRRLQFAKLMISEWLPPGPDRDNALRRADRTKLVRANQATAKST